MTEPVRGERTASTASVGAIGAVALAKDRELDHEAAGDDGFL